MSNGSPDTAQQNIQRCAVLHPVRKSRAEGGRDPQSCLDEAVGLAQAIELNVVLSSNVGISQVRPATLMGKGAVENIAAQIKELDITLAVVDCHLSPVQQRNLEKSWSCKVIDRTGLILEIFGARARTREGTLQVELAALSYQRSRLVRSWTHLERQRGGFGFLGGPGETQIEADRRMIGDRIVRLKKELEEVKRTRELHRSARRRVPYPIVALVGYTNAGKSTLFNRLTGASVLAQDLLFATLDPTMRHVTLPSGRRVILSDTVGFVSDLPHELVAAFRATLEEVLEADLIVHVRDISHVDSDAQAKDVENVLADLGLNHVVDQGLFEVWNKIDRLGFDQRSEMQNQAARKDLVLAASALSGEGIEQILHMIDGRLSRDHEIASLTIPHHDGAQLAWLYRFGQVVNRTDDECHIHLQVKLSLVDWERYKQRWNDAKERSHD